CVVVKTRNSDNQKYLAAYVLCPNKDCINEIMNILKTKLPEYMLPAVISVLGEFPLTLGGKIDRKLLPEPEFLGLSGKEYQPPLTDLQIQLTKIFADVLNLPKISINDNF